MPLPPAVAGVRLLRFADVVDRGAGRRGGATSAGRAAELHGPAALGVAPAARRLCREGGAAAEISLPVCGRVSGYRPDATRTVVPVGFGARKRRGLEQGGTTARGKHDI